MKSLVVKILIIALLVVCFGSGVWQTIDYIEDRIISTTVNMVDDSEFVSEIRTMIKDIVDDTIRDLVSHGRIAVVEDGSVVVLP